MTVEVSDFEAEVLTASHDKPVVVDFWAPWCGPCRVLGPVLEKLAAENEGWTLAKVNTDENPAVASRYGIQGIPAVKLFVDGNVADEFVGALPEARVRQWLEKALPSRAKELLEDAEAALAAADTPNAKSLARQVLDLEPDNARASALLARIEVFERPAEAVELARRAASRDAGLVTVSEAVRTLAGLIELADKPGRLPAGPARDSYLAAVKSLRERDPDAALANLIGVLRADPKYDDGGARKACIALFTVLGEQHEATGKHRRAFEMALF